MRRDKQTLKPPIPHIWHSDTWDSISGSWRTEEYRLSPSLFSDVFHCSLTLLARLHWLRAWERLCDPDNRKFKQQRFWAAHDNRKWIFCLLICLDATKSVLLRRFTQIYVQYHGSRVQNVRFRLTFVMTIFDCLPSGHHWRSQVDCVWRTCRRSVDRKHEHCFGWQQDALLGQQWENQA